MRSKIYVASTFFWSETEYWFEVLVPSSNKTIYSGSMIKKSAFFFSLDFKTMFTKH